VWLWEPGRGSSPSPPVERPPRSEPLLCDGWADRELEGREGALWIWGGGRARLDLAASRPAGLQVFVDGERVLVREELRGRATFDIPLAGRRWHALVLRSAPGLRIAGVALP
jgi:hypothetical protein